MLRGSIKLKIMKKLKGLIFTLTIIGSFLGFLHYYQIERTLLLQEAIGKAHYENQAYEKAITAYEKIKDYKNDDFAFNLMLTKLYTDYFCIQQRRKFRIKLK